MDLLEREEKLRLARKKLSKFQKKKGGGDHSGAVLDTAFSSGTVTPTYDASIHHYSSTSGPITSELYALAQTVSSQHNHGLPEFRSSSPHSPVSLQPPDMATSGSNQATSPSGGRRSMFGSLYSAVTSVAGNIINAPPTNGSNGNANGAATGENLNGERKLAVSPSRTSSESTQARLVSLLRNSGTQFGNMLDETTKSVRETASAVTGTAFSLYKDINSQGSSGVVSPRSKSPPRQRSKSPSPKEAGAPSGIPGPPPMSGFVPRNVRGGQPAGPGGAPLVQNIDLGAPPMAGFVPKARGTPVPNPYTAVQNYPTSRSRSTSPAKDAGLFRTSGSQNYSDIDDLVLQPRSESPGRAQSPTRSYLYNEGAAPQVRASSPPRQSSQSLQAPPSPQRSFLPQSNAAARNRSPSPPRGLPSSDVAPIPDDLFGGGSGDAFSLTTETLSRPPLSPPRTFSRPRDPSPIPQDLFGASHSSNVFDFTRPSSPPRAKSPERIFIPQHQALPSPTNSRSLFNAQETAGDVSELFGGSAGHGSDFFGISADPFHHKTEKTTSPVRTTGNTQAKVQRQASPTNSKGRSRSPYRQQERLPWEVPSEASAQTQNDVRNLFQSSAGDYGFLDQNQAGKAGSPTRSARSPSRAQELSQPPSTSRGRSKSPQPLPIQQQRLPWETSEASHNSADNDIRDLFQQPAGSGVDFFDGGNHRNSSPSRGRQPSPVTRGRSPARVSFENSHPLSDDASQLFNRPSPTQTKPKSPSPVRAISEAHPIPFSAGDKDGSPLFSPAEKRALEWQVDETKRTMEEYVLEKLQYQKKCEDLIAERDQLVSQLAHMQTEDRERRLEAESAQRHLEELKDKLDRREGHLKAMEDAIKAREEMVEFKSRSLTATEGELESELEIMRMKLESDFARKHEELERSRASVDDERQALKEVKEGLRRKEEELQESLRQAHSLDEEARRLDDVRARTERAENAALEKEAKLQSDAAALDRKAEELDMEGYKLDQWQTRLESESRQLASEREILDGRVLASQNLEAELKSRRDELDSLSRELIASKQSTDALKHRAEHEIQRAAEIKHQAELERSRVEEDRARLLEREAQLRARNDEFLAGNQAVSKESEKLMQLRNECEEDRIRLEADRIALLERERRLTDANEELLKRSTSIREETEKLAQRIKDLSREQTKIEEREKASKKIHEENVAKQQTLENSIRAMQERKDEIDALFKQREARLAQEFAKADKRAKEMEEKEKALVETIEKRQAEMDDKRRQIESERIMVKEKEASLKRLMDDYEAKIAKLPSSSETGGLSLDAKKRTAELESDRDRLASDLKSSTARVKDLISRLESSERSNHQFQSNVIKLTEMLEAEKRRAASTPSPDTTTPAVNQKLATLETKLQSMAAEESKLKEALMSMANSHADLEKFRREAQPMLEEMKVRSATSSSLPSSSVSSKPPVYPSSNGRPPLHVRTGSASDLADRTKVWTEKEVEALQDSALAKIMDATEYDKLVADKASYDLLNVIVALTSTNQNLTKKLEEAKSATGSPQLPRTAKSPAATRTAISARSSTMDEYPHSADQNRRLSSRSPSPSSRSFRSSISRRPSKRDDGLDSESSIADGTARRRPTSAAASYAAPTYASDQRRGRDSQAPHSVAFKVDTSPVRGGYTSSSRNAYSATRTSPAAGNGRRERESDIDDGNLESQSEVSEIVSPTTGGWFDGSISGRGGSLRASRLGDTSRGIYGRPVSREEERNYGASTRRLVHGIEDDPLGTLPTSKDLRASLSQRRKSTDRGTVTSNAHNRRSTGNVAGATSPNEGLRSYFTDEDMAGFSETTRRILFGGSAGGAGGDVPSGASRPSGGLRKSNGLSRAVSDTEGIMGRSSGRSGYASGGNSGRASAMSSPAVGRKESLRDVIRNRVKEIDFGVGQ
ncbi:hypothetical protein HDU97_000149 [Phlyctochytrium planicorne]|nr:hypothetical protein HDU97_000149 [Phlyctochytrium planicorne]